MSKNSSIQFQDYFKLYVLFKDKIIFEELLFKNDIKFCNDDNEILNDSCRYFLLNKDRNKIDKLLIGNKIIASTETIPTYDYRENIKVQRIFFLVILVVIVLMVIAIFIFD
ncbi:hypothetical protein FIA58_019810 [Flavobacterium jejuense]|uniref:Uncharacterized protein n=1 Tax=Flavobacterium jejuense TaxID=1544455 RepID=A0ABX0J1Z7_9FLAO|nr:hypothetical protein [Flavobacterium jejuense]NHN27930.1 hypothetical protein [Flavobacterium jejuense]